MLEARACFREATERVHCRTDAISDIPFDLANELASKRLATPRPKLFILLFFWSNYCVGDLLRFTSAVRPAAQQHPAYKGQVSSDTPVTKQVVSFVCKLYFGCRFPYQS